MRRNEGAVEHWDAELVLDARAQLGEGPLWDARRDELLWVDIDRGLVHRFDPRTGEDTALDVGEPVGAVVTRARGGLALALRSGFALLDEGAGEPYLVAPVEADRPETRLNDGACDGRGRFFAGTMHMAYDPGRGSLYRLDADGTVVTVLAGVTVSNGIAWNPDGTVLYYVDTPTGGVDAFDFDPVSGAVSNRRRAVTIEPAAGLPDGLVVDADGCLWVALWEGWSVRRYRADGELLGVVDVPAARVTKCAFGGPALDELYVTSARPDAASADQPHAGGLFLARPGVRGLPATPFAG